MSRVSVIVPNYNHSKYLVQRIESILAQTYQDFEVLILDDCSTDNSKEIIENYRNNPKVSQIIYNEKNSRSPFIQWRKGIEASRGEYIWIAESDDWCEATLLEDLIKGIIKDDNCVISYCQSSCVDETGKIIFQSNHHHLSELIDGAEFIEKNMSLQVSIFNASMAIWKKEKFKEITNDYTNFKFCGDWLFWISLAKLGKVHISGKVLNYFRKHDNDVSGKAYKSGLNFLEELKILNTIFLEGLISERIYYRAFKQKYFIYLKVRHSIEKINKAEIQLLFEQCLTPKFKPLLLRASAFWKKIKR
ncbi:glycosyltransferase family 2 protein [Pedobacter sp. MR2016-24]|uniref:glycosyltransferase family 2 protein n=1 Tax=Pedobacter sp. MR2016-24 TaxID=2994466 RepID=UPI0022451990|nr:glycosyltransferase family 2 protein [Pedobacter sp. MR2016-24]MCX2482118.1 glycosyltransferase family 2 protein [Pedobacter sp. MR2016-24]